MAMIEADNPDIEKELRRLVGLVESGGGGLHSGVKLICRDGGLSIETAEPMASGREIIRLSRDVLLPSTQYDLVVRKDAFQVEFPKNSALSPLQKSLAESMAALYTLTNKPALHKQHSFLLSLAAYPEILDLVAGGRMFAKDLQRWVAETKEGFKGRALDKFISETFLKTRHLGYSDFIKVASVSVIMPVIDFLNHHWSGAIFTLGKGVRKGDLCVAASQPVTGSLECYAFYGVMDAFDALIRYDFIDASAPIVRSVPVELEAPGGWRIKINSVMGAGSGNARLPKSVADLSRYLPAVTLQSEEKLLTASHIIIPGPRAPLALRRTLNFLLGRAGEAVPDAARRETWVREAESLIVDRNIAYYRNMKHRIQVLLEAHPGNAGLNRMAELCDVQTAKVEKYALARKQQDAIKNPGLTAGV
jgi:hypothetical protein